MKSFETTDGVRLHYLESGSGAPLVLLHGWSQSADLFKHQLVGLGPTHHAFALDMRGHGLSEKPTHGYRLSRLAKDLHEFLEALDLREITLFGHSMGCSVIWCYWDLFGAERVARLVLVDQHPVLVADPEWTAVERQSAGAILECADLQKLVHDLRGPDGEAVTETLLAGMVTAAMPRAERSWLLEINLQLPRPLAARMIHDVATHDWRDTIPRLSVPTLVVSGRASPVPWQSQVWIHEQVAGSHLEIFEEAEGGGHFMFLENPAKFNAITAAFIDAPRDGRSD
ncbi:MAG: alpha/beta hydrolase [Alphaproteobacteria bacterium]|nr:alpha/beta hydrolase [Alphaproteobacteria bacterium]